MRRWWIATVAVAGLAGLSGCGTSSATSAASRTTLPTHPAGSSTTSRPATSTSSTVPASSTSVTSTTAAGPPCTSAAVDPVAEAGDPSQQIPAATGVDGFGCAGDFAYAFVLIPAQPGGTSYEATRLLKASGSSWTVVDRAAYCPADGNSTSSPVPAAIFRDACQTN